MGAGRRENQEPVTGGVAREVEQDVDPIAADLRGERVVGEPGDVAPVVGTCREPMGIIVAIDPVVIADHLERPSIEVLEHADEEIADGMAAKVGRDESQAQRPLGVAVNVR